MRKINYEKLKGNDRFEGFGVELIEKLAAMLDFTFRFQMYEGTSYGKYDNKTGEWDGMLGELNKYRADLAITDLTITAERESAFDFTSPFMILGISILYQQPKAEDPDLTSFLKPFSYGVWMCLFGSFILVSISLFIAGRLSSEDWENPFPCIEEPDVLHNQLTIKNCIWFAMGSLFQQGSDIAPR
jgi:glutamate receptor, ionotropic, invertebrate